MASSIANGMLPGSARFTSQIEGVQKYAARHPSGCPTAKLLLAFLSIAFAVGVPGITPPPPKICGTLHGPSVTAPRLRLPDGRSVAYAEAGVAKQEAEHKVVVAHDYGRSRLDLFPCTRATMEELGVYMVSFDRAGYGESHPLPHRSIKSEAYDIEHLADSLQLGPKFHVIAIGIGAYSAWGCLKYIPHRLAGVALVAPVANFWWPRLRPAEARESFNNNLEAADQYTLAVAHYAPRLLYWWTTQEWLPSSDMQHLSQSSKISEVATQQGVHESIHRDLMIHFGNWEFDPTMLENPFTGTQVHVWQSDEDPWFPSSLQHHFKSELPWMKFHKIPGKSHSLVNVAGLPERILTTLISANQTL